MVCHPAIAPPAGLSRRLLAAYLATEYRVRLPGGGHAGIHIGQALPPALAALVGPHAWGFISAWNPRSAISPAPANRLAQRHLLAAIRALSPRCCRAGMGLGAQAWREAGLFVVGPEAAVFCRLARRFGQLAWVGGVAGRPAQLHWSGLGP